MKKYAGLALVALMTVNAAAAQAEGKNGIAAVINGDNVTVDTIKQIYEASPQIKSQASFADFYPKALDIFVNGQVLYQAAEGENIMDTPEYQRQLEIAKEEIARKVYLEKKVGNKVDDAAVKKLYEEYKANFKNEKEIKAKHILVADEATAKDIIEKLKKGEKFDDLAKRYSKEQADLGYFTKNMMVPEFGNAAFSMKKGETSKAPVKTQFGYHVILVEDIRDAKPLPLKQVEPQLRAMLTQQQVGAVFQNLLKNSKVTKYDLKGNIIPNTTAQ